MKKTILFLLLMALLSSCIAEPQQVDACVSGDPAGFWLGLWHGIIAPVTFILSLFEDSIAVYAMNNNGHWYDFGFLLGVGAFGGGLFKASSRRNKAD